VYEDVVWIQLPQERRRLFCEKSYQPSGSIKTGYHLAKWATTKIRSPHHDDKVDK
jgi:hypothetical protein